MSDERRSEGRHMRAPCPMCNVPSVSAHYPFCSRVCRDRDLHRWFNGLYAIAANEDDERVSIDEEE